MKWKKLLGSTSIILFCFLLFSSFIFSSYADWEIAPEWVVGDSWEIDQVVSSLSTEVIFRTSSNEAEFGIDESVYIGSGTDFYFDKIEVNSTHLWLDKIHSDKHYTRYCISTTNPYDVRLIIDSWFPTGNSSARVQIVNPTSTAINLQLYSPNLISAYATGVSSYTWYSANQTLFFTGNSDVNPYITIYATVSETSRNITPENYDVEITDMEGGGNWVWTESKYYTFQAQYWDGDGHADLDTMKIMFTAGSTDVIAVYNQQDDEWTLESGDDIVNLQGGTVTVLDTNLLQVTFPIYFQNTVLDTLDIDISMWCNDTSNAYDGWEVKAADYFNIYNLGKFASYSFTGSGGHTVGGDAYEIYAGGAFGADIFEDNFESGELMAWSVYTPNSTYNYVEIQDRWFYGAAGYHKAMHIVDDGAYTTFAAHGFRSQTGTFTFQAQVFPVDNDECLSIQFRTQGEANAGPWIKFEEDSKIYFVNATSPYDYYIQDYTGNTWYNVTLVMDVDADTYDIHIAGSLKNSSVSFYEAKASINELRFTTDSGGVPTSEDTDIYIDDVKVYVTTSGGFGGTAEVTVTIKDLQHFHTQFAIGIPGGTYELHNPDEGYAEFSIDYCIDGEWITSGWKVQINITDAWIAGASGFGDWFGGKNWIELEISWYNRNQYVTSDTIYTFWEGGPGDIGTSESDVDRFRLWLDLWFNTINASTTIGGRVSSFYYGMSDESNVVTLVLIGADWRVMLGEAEFSDFFHNLEDGDGNIVSCREIEMMRVRAKVWRSENYDFQWVLKDFKLVGHEVAPGLMEGIETPIPHETQKAALYTGGFLESLSLSMGRLGGFIWDAWGPSILGFWDTFVGFVDGIFEYFGYPNAFSLFLGWLGSLWGWIGTAFDWVIIALTSFFAFLGSFFGKMLNTVSTIVTQWVSVFNTFFAMLDGTYTAGIHIWNDLGLATWVVLIAILYPLYLFAVWDEHGIDRVLGHIKMMIDIAAFVLNILIRVIQLTLNVLGRIIESIPVVE